jgi:hypothetical protein
LPGYEKVHYLYHKHKKSLFTILLFIAEKSLKGKIHFCGLKDIYSIRCHVVQLFQKGKSIIEENYNKKF